MKRQRDARVEEEDSAELQLQISSTRVTVQYSTKACDLQQSQVCERFGGCVLKMR